jgi:hypothetical protein
MSLGNSQFLSFSSFNKQFMAFKTANILGELALSVLKLETRFLAHLRLPKADNYRPAMLEMRRCNLPRQ